MAHHQPDGALPFGEQIIQGVQVPAIVVGQGQLLRQMVVGRPPVQHPFAVNDDGLHFYSSPYSRVKVS